MPVDAVVDISFGFRVAFSEGYRALTEVIMKNPFVLVACVRHEVAFLRSLADDFNPNERVCTSRYSRLPKKTPGGSNPPLRIHQFS